MGIFDGLPNPVAPALAFQEGLEHGKAQREEREVRGALADYVTNPDDPRAFRTLAQYRPEIAMQVRQDQQKRARDAQVADLQRRAATGDRAAQAELWGIAPDTADKIGDNHRAELQQRIDAIGQAALRIEQMPAAERPAAWDAAVDQLSATYPEVAEYKGRYSEEALMSAIDTAHLVSEHFNLTRPNYTALPPGAKLVNTRDPAAVASVAGGAASSTPPPDAIEALKRGEGSPAQFDEIFGPGSAARYMGNGGGGARVTSNFLDGL